MRSSLPHYLTRLLHTLLLAGMITAPPVFSAQFNLTVTNGSGSGSYEEGSVVHIEAAPAPYVSEVGGAASHPTPWPRNRYSIAGAAIPRPWTMRTRAGPD